MDIGKLQMFDAYRNLFRVQFALEQKAIVQKVTQGRERMASLASGVPRAVEGETLIITAIKPEVLTA